MTNNSMQLKNWEIHGLSDTLIHSVTLSPICNSKGNHQTLNTFETWTLMPLWTHEERQTKLI